MLRTEFYKILLIGTNKTGKTYYWLNSIAKPTIKANPNKKVILVSGNFDDETLKGVPKIRSFEKLKRFKSGVVQFWDREYAKKGHREVFKKIYQYIEAGILAHGSITFDDATKYFRGGNIDDTTAAFLTDYRHFKLDVYWMFHAIKKVPPGLWSDIHGTVLKKTLEPNYSLAYFEKDRQINNAHAFYKAYRELQRVNLQIKPQKWMHKWIPTGL